MKAFVIATTMVVISVFISYQPNTDENASVRNFNFKTGNEQMFFLFKSFCPDTIKANTKFAKIK